MACRPAEMPPALAKLRTAEARRTGRRRDHPASVMAGLGKARRKAARQRAEFAVVIDPAVKTAAARVMAPVPSFHAVGVDHTRRGTGDQQHYGGGNLTHDPSSGFLA